jgi:hypothetical protein
MTDTFEDEGPIGSSQLGWQRRSVGFREDDDRIRDAGVGGVVVLDAASHESAVKLERHVDGPSAGNSNCPGWRGHVPVVFDANRDVTLRDTRAAFGVRHLVGAIARRCGLVDEWRAVENAPHCHGGTCDRLASLGIGYDALDGSTSLADHRIGPDPDA